MKKGLVIVLVLVILLGAGAAWFFTLPTLTMVSDYLYAETSYAQVKDDFFVALLKQGVRLKSVVWNPVPENDQDTQVALSKLKGDYVLCSPVITISLSREERLPDGPLFIGMGNASFDTALFSIMLSSEEDAGYADVVDAGKVMAFVYQGKKPDVERLFVRSERLNDNETLASLALKEAGWAKDNVDTLVLYHIKDYPVLFSGSQTIPYKVVVPSLNVLSVPKENIAGVIIDDLSNSLGMLKSLKKDTPQLTLPLQRSYRSGARMRGGLLRQQLQSLLRFFR